MFQKRRTRIKGKCVKGCSLLVVLASKETPKYTSSSDSLFSNTLSPHRKDRQLLSFFIQNLFLLSRIRQLSTVILFVLQNFGKNRFSLKTVFLLHRRYSLRLHPIAPVDIAPVDVSSSHLFLSYFSSHFFDAWNYLQPPRHDLALLFSIRIQISLLFSLLASACSFFLFILWFSWFFLGSCTRSDTFPPLPLSL